MRVEQTELPASSLIRQFLPADYTDTFTCRVDGVYTFTPDDVMVAFWLDMPPWVETLMAIRNRIMHWIGANDHHQNDAKTLEQCIRNNAPHPFASIAGKSGEETVLLLRDTHLNAYIAARVVHSHDGTSLFLSTLVHFHNRLGKVYFFIIKPFHNLIVRALLKRVVRSLTAKASPKTLSDI